MYHFSLTLHVFSLIKNRADIEYCLIWQEKRASIEEMKLLSILVSKIDFFFSFSDLFFIHKH